MYLQENRKAKPIRKCKYSPSSAGMIRAKAAQPSTVQNIAFPPFMSAKGKKADIKRTGQKRRSARTSAPFPVAQPVNLCADPEAVLFPRSVIKPVPRCLLSIVRRSFLSKVTKKNNKKSSPNLLTKRAFCAIL